MFYIYNYIHVKICIYLIFLKLVIFFFGCPLAYGSSGARDQIQAAALIHTTAVAMPDP